MLGRNVTRRAEVVLPGGQQKPASRDFDEAAALSYWRHAPSGLGKHDTNAMLGLEPSQLVAQWDAAFRARITAYPEEEEFFRVMSKRLARKRVASIGSGLGFQELLYAKRGAQVRCLDVVDSNLSVLRRVAATKGIKIATALVSDLADPSYGAPGSADVVLFYGSIMTMPEAVQARALEQAFRLVGRRGTVILMTYTWEFAHQTCGWDDLDDFDPTIFARASDPTVEGEDCPWSDWHNREKLLALSPKGTRVRRAQVWNQDLYEWFELDQRRVPRQTGRFFAPSALERGALRGGVGLDEWERAEGEVVRLSEGLELKAYPGVSYAALSPVVTRFSQPANALVIDVTLRSGTISVGLLDVGSGRFAATMVVGHQGRSSHLMTFPELPSSWQVIVSNHDPSSSVGASATLNNIQLLERPVTELP